MRRWIFSVVLALSILSISEQAFSQTSTFPWPMNPPVGIGITVPQNALQLNFNSSGHNDTAIIRLSNSAPTSIVYGIIGLMPFSYPYYSSISTGEDLIIHEHSQGDIILTNYQSTSISHPFGAIRFATTPGSSDLPLIAPPPHDVERLSINPNGNIGIDIPPSIWSGLDSARDQLQLGGGATPPLGELDPLPGLTFYGGNRFEGMLKSGLLAGSFPLDWRYIGFNYGCNHSDTSSARFFRSARTGASNILFDDRAGGLIQLNGLPYDSALGMHDFSHYVTLQISGQQGLSMYTYFDSSITNLHLFDIWPPGYQGYGGPTDTVTNDSGLCVIHTPVYIGGGPSWFTPNFTNFAHVNPDIGDGHTWQLVVNGPMLAREVFVLDSTWADYVFDPGYKLPLLSEVENFVKANHHLPDIEPASKIAKTGVPIGRTEEALTKQLEEEILYIEQLNHKIEKLESEVQELNNQKGK